MLPDPMSRPAILCVDDYETSLGGWCLYLQGEGYLVTTAMRDNNGDDVVESMNRIKPDVRILMLSGVPNIPENARLHVDAFLQKGESPTVVLEKIRDLLNSSGKAA
jgi:CheY-like chemotaxis protein